MLDRVLIAARGPDGVLRRRIQALARWYGKRAEIRAVAGGTVTVAAIGAPLQGAAFGEEPPVTLDLIAADDRGLRRYVGGGVALAFGPGRARVVAGAAAPASLYGARGCDVSAWSTHAVAAAYASTGSAAVDPHALPEQIAAEFVGGGRSLVADVRVLAAGSYVDMSAARAVEACFLPAAERWMLVPEAEAHEFCEQSLLRTLEARLDGVARPLVGLTAGLDSRVAALALAELGIPAEGYTWGPAADVDVAGGAEAAARIGMQHRRVGFDYRDAAAGLRRTRADARWTEGAIHVGFGGIAWPADLAALVTGAGGETGRCFYYPDRTGSAPDALARVVSEQLVGRIAGARPDAVDGFHGRVRGWVADAERTGLTGWRLLDVVYAEQRVARWLRGMLPTLAVPMVAAFTPPDVQRGLLSLPIEERAVSGFHRRFIRDRIPDLLPGPAAAAPPASRSLATRIVRRLRRGSLDGDWTSRPEYRDWIAEGVLGHPLAVEGMGPRWCRRTRSRFSAGDAFAVERALWLGGPIALAEALDELPPG